MDIIFDLQDEDHLLHFKCRILWKSAYFTGGDFYGLGGAVGLQPPKFLGCKNFGVNLFILLAKKCWQLIEPSLK